MTREQEQGNEFPDLLLPADLRCDRSTEEGAAGICPFVAGALCYFQTVYPETYNLFMLSLNKCGGIIYMTQDGNKLSFTFPWMLHAW